MKNSDINDILLDYRNNKISAEELNTIQAENTDVDWNQAMKEDDLIQTMFQANFYESLKTQMDADIDKIERKSKIVKISVASIIALSILGAGGYFYAKTETKPSSIEKKEVKSQTTVLKQTDTSTIAQTPIIQENNTGAIPNQVSTPKKAVKQMPNNTISKITVTPTPEKSIILTIPVVETITKNKENAVIEEKKATKTPATFEEKKTIVAPSTPKVETPKPKVEEGTKATTVTKNYIINPDLGESLTIEAAALPTTLSIQNMSGNVVFEKTYEEGESINWDGKNLNNNTLPNALYIYRLSRENKMIQFGQITLVQ
jgi:hypothetical protein